MGLTMIYTSTGPQHTYLLSTMWVHRTWIRCPTTNRCIRNDVQEKIIRKSGHVALALRPFQPGLICMLNHVKQHPVQPHTTRIQCIPSMLTTHCKRVICATGMATTYQALHSTRTGSMGNRADSQMILHLEKNMQQFSTTHVPE